MTDPIPNSMTSHQQSPDPGSGSSSAIQMATTAAIPRRRSKRRLKIPILLFVATCLSTFWVGVTSWQPRLPLYRFWPTFGEPSAYQPDPYLLEIREILIGNWQQGLLYMSSILLILLLHEFGHFFTAVYHRVPATVPIFLPFPFNPFGTLGAVIGMEGTSANRPQIFDIGIAGPLAGLVAAIPLALIGISQLDLSPAPQTGIGFQLPLLMNWMVDWIGVEGYDRNEGVVWLNQLNPYFAAAWIGLVITGLNMMPVGQLDGGHIVYTLFGKKSFWIADATIVLAVAFMVYFQHPILILMVGLVLLMGTRHPPTADDTVPLGPVRWCIGVLSLAIPVLCFPPMLLKIAT